MYPAGPKPGESAKVAEGLAKFTLSRVQPGFELELEPDARLPSSCASCCGLASTTRRESSAERQLLVPYCSACAERLLRQGTAQAVASVVSVVLAVTLILTLPRLAPSLPLLGYTAVALVAALIPPAIVWAVRPAVRESGATSVGRAAWWSKHKFCCTNQRWVEQISGVIGAPKPRALRVPVVVPSMFAGAGLVLVGAPLAYDYLHPQVIALNLGAPEFELLADGVVVGRVVATSLESPEAGLRFRLGVGQRELLARTLGGRTLLSEQVELEAGKTYLYAPLSEEYCFWLEHDDYGRRAAPERHYRVLPQDREFWALPREIDSWFSANPLVTSDKRSTGGSLTALRQARCEESPPEVRTKTAR